MILYKDIIGAIMSMENGAITTLNGVHYENIHQTARIYAKVKRTDSGALMCKEQMLDLLNSMKSSKCRIRAVGARKMK